MCSLWELNHEWDRFHRALPQVLSQQYLDKSQALNIYWTTLTLQNFDVHSMKAESRMRQILLNTLSSALATICAEGAYHFLKYNPFNNTFVTMQIKNKNFLIFLPTILFHAFFWKIFYEIFFSNFILHCCQKYFSKCFWKLCSVDVEHSSSSAHQKHKSSRI